MDNPHTQQFWQSDVDVEISRRIDRLDARLYPMECCQLQILGNNSIGCRWSLVVVNKNLLLLQWIDFHYLCV